MQNVIRHIYIPIIYIVKRAIARAFGLFLLNNFTILYFNTLVVQNIRKKLFPYRAILYRLMELNACVHDHSVASQSDVTRAVEHNERWSTCCGLNHDIIS